ncbi:MAG: hypothetical protein ACR2HM_06155 [Acidimicrobiales bacterium]
MNDDRSENLVEIDLVVDLNTMDDSGLPWAFLDRAVHPERIRPGAHVVVGAGSVRAIAKVIDVTDGIVHVDPLRGSLAANAHLLSA